MDRYVYRSSHIGQIRGLRVIPLNLITPPPPPYSIKLYQLKYPYLNSCRRPQLTTLRLPRHNLQLVCLSQAAQPPSQSSLHPQSQPGSGAGLRHSVQLTGRSTVIRATVPTSDGPHFKLCSGAWTFSHFVPLFTLLLLTPLLFTFFSSFVAFRRAAAALFAPTVSTWRTPNHIAQVNAVRGFLEVCVVRHRVLSPRIYNRCVIAFMSLLVRSIQAVTTSKLGLTSSRN